MNKKEFKATFSLATIFFSRMFGVFVILPVFAVYAYDYPDVTPQLIGLALGIYGLTQALFHIPLGIISDRFGRKPIIFLGLVSFAIGSVVAATADSLWGIILGRAIQGAGAVGSVAFALTADLTKGPSRTQAMAIIGITIGASFAVAMVLGPILSTAVGLSGLFWITAGLALVGIVTLFVLVPKQPAHTVRNWRLPASVQLHAVFNNKELLRLHIGLFVLHMVLTAIFVVIPLQMVAANQTASLPLWQIYLSILFFAFVIALPTLWIADHKGLTKQLYLVSIAGLAISLLALGLLPLTLFNFMLGLLLFFITFTILEALIPSLVARFAPTGSRGTAMGFYSTAQYLGIFVGGIAGGNLYTNGQALPIFLFSLLLVILWLLIARSMTSPTHIKSHSIHIGTIKGRAAQKLTREIKSVTGVIEVLVVADESTAYLKINKETIDTKHLEQFSVDYTDSE